MEEQLSQDTGLHEHILTEDINKEHMIQNGSTKIQEVPSDEELSVSSVQDDTGFVEEKDLDSFSESELEEHQSESWLESRLMRNQNPELPETVTRFQTEDGGRIYVVGTAHFSRSSQEDVAKTIQATQPDVVVVELCKSRVNILQYDEETLLEEAKNINFEKLRTSIKQTGLIQGIMHLLLLSMSAHLTKQLGMAPGGEFRTAFQEAQKVDGCQVHLGDRPIQITLQRAIASLSWWQKLRLAWYMLTSKEPISKEEVERCKQRDLLEEMLREMTGEFPALSRVFVQERDIFLAHSLRIAARPIPCPQVPSGYIPCVVVGVVGIGHVPGIAENWDIEKDIASLMIIPEGSVIGKVFRLSFKAALVALVSLGCYRVIRWTAFHFIHR